MGKVIKKVAGFVGKVIKNPIFSVGLLAVTGGMSGLLTKGISALSGGSLGGIFSNLAKKFLPQIGSFLGGGANGILGNFLNSAANQGSGGIADIFSRLVQGFRQQPQQQLDQQSQQMAQQNIQQQAAYWLAQSMYRNQPA